MFRTSNHDHRQRSMKIFQSALLITFWHFTLLQYRFDSPQVKRELISSVTLRLCILGSQEIFGLPQNQMDTWLSTQSPQQKQIFGDNGKKYAKAFRFRFCLMLFDFFTFCQIFCPRLQALLKINTFQMKQLSLHGQITCFTK